MVGERRRERKERKREEGERGEGKGEREIPHRSWQHIRIQISRPNLIINQKI